MSWDPALLRKYSSTNHYKLLNQVRSDLKEQPIQRSKAQGNRRGASGGSTGETCGKAPDPPRKTPLGTSGT